MACREHVTVDTVVPFMHEIVGTTGPVNETAPLRERSIPYPSCHRPRGRHAAVFTIMALGFVSVYLPAAHATFPGANGSIAFTRENPHLVGRRDGHHEDR